MSDLQAAIEFQVELGRFYNVDLFQRGYYQIRTALKMSPKVTAKVDVSLQKESESRLVLPGSVLNGVAVSKTFQILYRKEDIDINDVIAFKVYMLVDMLKIDEIISEADFQLNVELWFTEEDVSPTQQEKLQCLSQRTLKLHFVATKGIHHHVPLLFDYFHLSAICLTVHGTLIALHQPYISLSRSQQKASAKVDQSLESALFSSSSSASSSSSSSSSRNNNVSSKSRKKIACQRHRRFCQILLSAYESIQTSYENLAMQLHDKLPVKIDHVDCRLKLEEFSKKCEAYASTAEEEDLFQAIQSDLATLCSQNVILWMQYLELVTQNDAVIHQLAKEHHALRVKRFSEGFFLNEYQKQEMIACFDPNFHGHNEIATQIRESTYFRSIPSLAVECTDVDGDSATMPIIFEDIYSEPALENAIRFRSEPGSSKALNRKSNRDSCCSNTSSTSTESSTSITRKSNRLKIIRNVRPESLRRPSSYMNVDNQVAVDDVDCTLVGYRKVDLLNPVLTPPVQLGTLSAADSELPPLSGYETRRLRSAVSLPLLADCCHQAVNLSGSLPDLAHNSSARRMPVWSKYRTSSKPLGDSSDSSATDILAIRVGNDCRDMTTMESCNGVKMLTKNNEDVELASRDWVEFQETSSLLGDGRETSQEMYRLKYVSTESTVLECEKNRNLLETSSGHLNPSRDCEGSRISRNVDRHSVAVIADEKSMDKDEAADDHLLVTELNSGVTAYSAEDSLSHGNENASYKDQTNKFFNSGSNSVDGVCRNAAETVTSSSLVNVDLASKTKESPKLDKNSVNAAGGVEAKSNAKIGSMSAANSISEKPQRLVDEVTDKLVRFISAKEILRTELDLHEHFYSDFPSQISSFPYFTPPDKFFPLPDEGVHLIVCVHGLDGNSTDLRLVRTYLELALPSNKVEFLMSERNQVDTFADFEVMTDRLVQEILYHVELFSIKPSRISFIGHSLGNLIIRSAMSRPQMTEFLPKLHTFLSLSGPHLGTLFNSSGLVNMGMWLMQKWKKSGSLLQLSLKDHHDPRQTFLYRLSQKTGLEFFRNILLVGSQQDRYVPFHSSRIELCKAALRDASGWGAVYTEMVNNILQPIIYKSDINFIRYDVFHALSGTTNHLIGRAAHIAVLDSELFIEKFVTVAALKYFI